MVDVYLQFIEFIKGKVDLLNGKSINQVTSWKFEAEVTEFVKNHENLNRLTELFGYFKAEQETNTSAQGSWVALTTEGNSVP